MSNARRPLNGKKLLVATVGVATLNLSGCYLGNSGNLMAPPPCDDAGNFDCEDEGAGADAGSADAGLPDAGTPEEGAPDAGSSQEDAPDGGQ